MTTYTLDLAAPLVQVLVQKVSSGDTRYLYGMMQVGEQQPVGWVYHLSDALGSRRQLADGSAHVALVRGYTPYGEPLWMQGTASSRYAFTGEDYDPAVGLVFLQARYMQPGLGIFLARDPWSGNTDYGLGNPINLVDGSGMCSPLMCKQNTIAWVQNSGGLALRGFDSLQSTIIKRMQDGTPIWVGPGFYFDP